MEGFHQLDYRDIRAVIDELVIGVGGIGPAPCISESVKLRLAHLTAGLAKENVVIGVRVKRRIEINKIDTRIGNSRPSRSHSKLSPKYNRFTG